MGTAVAYLRRSRVDARRPGVLSHEQQLDRIRETAARHGDDDLVIIEDWGKSGREEKTHLRSGFARLEQMIDAGEVSAVYAYDLSRLGRSLITVDRLARRCAELRIPVRCADGFSPDVSNAQGQLVLNILTAIGQFYAKSTQERMIALTMMRRQRGDRIGPAPFGQRVVAGKLEDNPAEDLEAVMGAYRRAGSVIAAARLLNAEGTRTRKGRPWQASSLTTILETAGLVTRRPRRGRPASRTFLFSGLLRCTCGGTLTARSWSKSGYVAYECKRAGILPGHPRPSSVSERAIAPLIRERFDALDWGADQAEMTAPAVDRDELEGRRRRVLELYKAGHIDRDEVDRDLADIDAQIDAAGRSAVIVDVRQAIDWTWPAEDVNRLLRLLVEHIPLNAAMEPLEPAWRGRIAEWAA